MFICAVFRRLLEGCTLLQAILIKGQVAKVTWAAGLLNPIVKVTRGGAGKWQATLAAKDLTVTGGAGQTRGDLNFAKIQYLIM